MECKADRCAQRSSSPRSNANAPGSLRRPLRSPFGRLRYDLSNDDAIELFLSGDQILKGAALNGIQIAEVWMRMSD